MIIAGFVDDSEGALEKDCKIRSESLEPAM